MIDRAGRTAVSEQLRHLVAGQITNDEFEDGLPVGSQDRGVIEVSEEAWYLYSDLWERRLTGAERVPDDARQHVARWILFLQSDLDECLPRGLARERAGHDVKIVPQVG